MGVLVSKYIATYIFIALNDVAIIFNLQQEVFFFKEIDLFIYFSPYFSF